MPLYTFSGMTVTSAPVSILNFTLTFLIWISTDHGSFPTPTIPMIRPLSFVAASTALANLQTLLKCPLFPHVWHVTPWAGWCVWTILVTSCVCWRFSACQLDSVICLAMLCSWPSLCMWFCLIRLLVLVGHCRIYSTVHITTYICLLPFYLLRLPHHTYCLSEGYIFVQLRFPTNHQSVPDDLIMKWPIIAVFGECISWCDKWVHWLGDLLQSD